MISERDRRPVTDRAVGKYLVTVSTPSLQLSVCVGKAEEVVIDAPLIRAPMTTRVKTLRPEPPVERLDEGILCWLVRLDIGQCHGNPHLA